MAELVEKLNKTKFKKHQAFTLKELAIVLVVIEILVNMKTKRFKNKT